MENCKIKNIVKYSDIKLAKGLCLDDIDTTLRENAELGISTTKYGRNWQMLPKGRAIFKTYDGYKLYQDIKEIRITNELLCYELSKQLGVLCAEYELATKNGITGLVSYEIKTDPNQKLITAKQLFNDINILSRNHFETYIDAIKKYKLLGYKIDSKKVLCDLYKISLFDTLTMQTDRHTNNVFMLIDNKKKTIKVAPILDNELSFASGVCYEILNSDSYIYPESIKSYTYMINKIIEVQHTSFSSNNFKANVKNLANLAKQDIRFNKIFKDFISNYDINKAIEKLKSQGVEINPKYEQFLVYTQDITKQMLLDEYNKTTITDNVCYTDTDHQFL